MSAMIRLVLSFFLLASTAYGADRAVIVLDASGSMWGQIDGTTKIEIARETLGEVLGSVGDDLALGLLAYGHRKKGDCADIELLVEPAAGTAKRIVEAAGAVQPKGKTPLSDAVAQAAEILKYNEEPATVILITDGLETCDRDPCALGEKLASTGVDFTAHVVGFGLSAEEGKQVACLADNTGGLYLEASNAEQLGDALSQTVVAAVEPEPQPVPEAPPPPDASLEADDQVPQSTRFRVTWVGPGERYDQVQIFDPAARAGEGKIVRRVSVRQGDFDDQAVEMIAPAKIGPVQLRYWDGVSRRVLATRDLEIVETEISLSAPETVESGHPIKIDWVGPGGRYDRIEVYDPNAMQGEGKVLNRQSVRHGDNLDTMTARLPAPAKIGTYLLRYWDGRNKTVLAEREIEVVEAEVSLSAPDTIEAGRTIRVEWVGPGANYDTVEIYDPNAMNGEGKVVRHKRLRNDDFENRKAKLAAPAKPGTYELRYWNGDNKAVLATRPIEVVAGTVALEAPDEIERARPIKVKWTGPGGQYDAVRIFDPDAMAGDGKVIHEKRLSHGDLDNNEVKLATPAKPGTYELQYWNGENKAVLATRPLEVTTSEVSLEAPDEVVVGSRFAVRWVGPGARLDDVKIVDASGKKVEGRRLMNGRYDDHEVDLKAPKKAGAYELQYWNGENRAVLATRPLTVTEPPAAPAE